MGLKVAVYTLGCKLNQCESEALASSFESRGFFITSPRDPADIYIVNTCTVTSKSEQKARRMIRKFASDFCGSVVIVTGCYAQLDKGDLNIADNVIVIPNDDKDRLNELPDYLAASLSLSDASLLELVKNFFVKADSPCMSNRFWFGSVDFSYHTRAFLKIQDGCNNKCAYCRVTIARGPSVSLSPDLVVKNYISLHEKGFREVVLTGINLTSYNSEGVNFSQLLIKLLEVAEKLEKPPRIRISSIEPDSIDSEMIKAVSNDLICPHFHISVQSGSDKILSGMRRHYNRQTVIEAVDALREIKEDPFFAADVIAGFPGETDSDFELTMSLLEDCGFSHLHVFPFSPRPDTAALKMEPKVPERISGERTLALRDLSARKYQEYISRWVGREVDVLIEDSSKNPAYGTSENYLKCSVFTNDEQCGAVCRCVIDDITATEIKTSFLYSI